MVYSNLFLVAVAPGAACAHLRSGYPRHLTLARKQPRPTAQPPRARREPPPLPDEGLVITPTIIPLWPLMVPGLLAALSLLITAPTATASDSGEGPDSELIVDIHWIDAYQEQEGKTLTVTENFWFNNTGNATFSGDLYAWLPEGAALTSLCVMESDSATACFSTVKVDKNLIKGSPFTKNPRNPYSFYTPFLSYFGQRADLTISASDRNGSVALTQTAQVGSRPLNQTVQASRVNLTLISKQEVLGASLGEGEEIPEKMALEHNLTLTNKGDYSRTVALEVAGLPPGWQAEIVDSEGANTTTLLPNETKKLTLKLKVPSYKVRIRLLYTYPLKVRGEDTMKATFEKELVYPTGRLEFYLFALPRASVTFSSNLYTLDKGLYEPYDREWFMSWGYEMAPQTRSAATISWETEDSTLDILWPASLVLVGLTFALPALYRSGFIGKKFKSTPKQDKPE